MSGGGSNFWCNCLKHIAPASKVRERNRINKHLVRQSPYNLKTHKGDLKDKKKISRGHVCGAGP